MKKRCADRKRVAVHRLLTDRALARLTNIARAVDRPTRNFNTSFESEHVRSRQPKTTDLNITDEVDHRAVDRRKNEFHRNTQTDEDSENAETISNGKLQDRHRKLVKKSGKVTTKRKSMRIRRHKPLARLRKMKNEKRLNKKLKTSYWRRRKMK